jgi:hypothetical protein
MVPPLFVSFLGSIFEQRFGIQFVKGKFKWILNPHASPEIRTAIEEKLFYS